MCGIVGAVAQRNIVPVLIDGLKRLEYRGYDSCGVALYQDRTLVRARSVARVARLEDEIETQQWRAYTGIAHTRWATHGKPVTGNAHPHFSPHCAAPRIAMSHNGIIENHEALRIMLQQQGYVFESQTDSEVIGHLIDHLYQGDLFEAVREAVARLRGSYAIAVLCRDEPHRLVGARHGSPLVIGMGEGEHFLASDAIALATVTDRIAYLEDGDVADIQLHRHWVVDAAGRRVERPVHTVQAHSAAADLGPYAYHMQKEIFEQPRAVADNLSNTLSDTLGPTSGDIGGVMPEWFGDGAWRVFRDTRSVLLLACGGSFHAALTA